MSSEERVLLIICYWCSCNSWLRLSFRFHGNVLPPSHQPRSAAPGQVATPRLTRAVLYDLRRQPNLRCTATPKLRCTPPPNRNP